MKRIIAWILSVALFMGASIFTVQAQPNTAPPSLSAKAAALTDQDGKLLYGKKEGERLPMASTTKIMTALLVAEVLPPDQRITVPPQAVGVEGSSVYLQEGEELSVSDLLYALLLASANDAACALAIAVSGSVEAFVARMNEKAESLGLFNTHFANPHGLPHDDHYTTAKELAILASCALANETVSKIAATQYATIPLLGKADGRCLRNHNKMLRLYDGAVGLKTGFTKISGRCLVSAARRDGLLLIAVTLNAPDDWRDHASLLDYGFSAFYRCTVIEADTPCFSYPITGGEREEVSLISTKGVAVTLAHKETPPQKTVEVLSHFAFAPIRAGDAAGTLTVKYEDGSVTRIPLVYQADVAKKTVKRGLLQRIFT